MYVWRKKAQVHVKAKSSCLKSIMEIINLNGKICDLCWIFFQQKRKIKENIRN